MNLHHRVAADGEFDLHPPTRQCGFHPIRTAECVTLIVGSRYDAGIGLNREVHNMAFHKTQRLPENLPFDCTAEHCAYAIAGRSATPSAASHHAAPASSRASAKGDAASRMPSGIPDWALPQIQGHLNPTT